MKEDQENLTRSLITLILSRQAGSEIVALAAEAVAAYARFNHRVSRIKYDKHITDDEFMALLDLTDVLLQNLQMAIQKFDVDANQETLCQVLSEIRRQLDQAAR